MLKIMKECWATNSNILKEKLSTGLEFNECCYKDLVKLTFETIYNTTVIDKLDLENITEIDNGDYQGTLLYLIPFDCYQPDECQYLMTYVGYGSCSVCDVLESLREWTYEGGKLLNENQISGFMDLCKDIICNTIKPYNYGWRSDSRFDVAEV